MASSETTQGDTVDGSERFDPLRDLTHHDPQQLLYQVREIFESRSYLRHGVEVRPGDTVLDAGANVGVTAAFFACEGAAAVHSFEPVPALFELLRQNTARFDACVPHRYGLSRESGPAAVTYYPNAAAMSGLYADPQRDLEQFRSSLRNLGVPAEEIPARTAGLFRPLVVPCELRTLSSVIDELGLERIDLLKLDVERAEEDVLAGHEQRHWPLVRQVAAEVHDEGGARIEVALAAAGFRVTAEQDRAMEGTEVRMLYGRRA